jgi:hypothetical protein
VGPADRSGPDRPVTDLIAPRSGRDDVARAQGNAPDTSTYRLKDGEIVSTGVVRLDSTQGLEFPIVGGSGAYRGAHGQVTPGAPVKGYDGVDVLHLDG